MEKENYQHPQVDSQFSQERRPIASIQSELFKIFSKARKAQGVENQTRETIRAIQDSMALLKNRVDFDDPEIEIKLKFITKRFKAMRTDEQKNTFMSEIFVDANELLAYNKRIWDRLGYYDEEEMQVMNVTMGIDKKVEGISPAVSKEARQLSYEDEEDEEIEFVKSDADEE